MKQRWLSRIGQLHLVSMALVMGFSSVASAASGSDFKTMNGIHFFDESGTASAICSVSGTLSGSDGKEKTWNYLIGKGLTPEQAAGIAGNFKVESGFIPDNQENNQAFPNGGWGLAQWTGTRRTNAAKTGIADEVQKAGLPYTNEQTPADMVDKLLMFELDYVWSEATGGNLGDSLYKNTINTLKSATLGKTGDEAVNIASATWQKEYERPTNPNPTERQRESRIIYAELKGTGSASTSVSAGCGVSVTDGVAYYSQYDPAWASSPYGSGASASTIEESGCGPTSMAMIISTLTGKQVTPKDVATFGANFYVPGEGSNHALFAAAATKWGLKSQSIPSSETAVKDVLSKGGLVVAGGSGAYPYVPAPGGHIIVIRGVTPDGKYLVANPLPLQADQGKPSSEVVKNTAWYSTAYTWGQVGVPASALYAITK